jgi:hypothetical protein
MIEYIDWPQIPKNIETLVLNYVNKTNYKEVDDSTNDSDNYYTNLINWDKSLGVSFDMSTPSAADFICLNNLPNELTDWSANNITMSVDTVSVQIITNGTQLLPHVDGYRKLAYNYVISASPETKTCFYDVVNEYKDYIVYPYTIIPYDRIIQIEEHYIKMHQWHKLDVTKIHSVENIQLAIPRIAITLSIKL